MSHPWTEEQYQALSEAIAEGSLEVEYDGRRTRYRSQREMLALLERIGKALGKTTGSARRVFMRADKGLDSE